MADWKTAFEESEAKRNSDFKVPVIASLKDRFKEYTDPGFLEESEEPEVLSLTEKRVAEGLDEKVKDWYDKTWSFTEGATLKDLTFKDLYIALGEGGKDLDNDILGLTSGNNTIIIRGSILVELAKRLHVDYEIVRALWVGGGTSRYGESQELKEALEGEEDEVAEEIQEEELNSDEDTLSKEEVSDINEQITEDETYSSSTFFTLHSDTELDEPVMILERDSWTGDFFSGLGNFSIKVRYSDFISEAVKTRAPEDYLRYLCRKFYTEVSNKFFDFIEDPTRKTYHTGLETSEALSDLEDSLSAYREVVADLMELLLIIPQIAI